MGLIANSICDGLNNYKPRICSGIIGFPALVKKEPALHADGTVCNYKSHSVIWRSYSFAPVSWSDKELEVLNQNLPQCSDILKICVANAAVPRYMVIEQSQDEGFH